MFSSVYGNVKTFTGWGICMCPLKILEKRERGHIQVPGTAQFLGVPPIMSGTGNATDFKLGQYIQRVHPNF